MYCHNCGTELPDEAKFCTNCGTPVSNSMQQLEEDYQDGTLRITRQSVFMARAIKTKVYVDSVFMDSVGDGQTIFIPLEPGSHVVELKTPGNGGTSRNFNLKSGQEIALQFKLTMAVKGYHDIVGMYDVVTREQFQNSDAPSRNNSQIMYPNQSNNGRTCPKCGGQMNIQAVSESRKTGCGTVILYILLTITVLGLLIVIPLMLRKKTETVTYAICQRCGYKTVLSRKR